MVVSTYKELIFKKSKKQHQILAQTAYYQAGKIVIQTILPEQPPVALITLNTLGTTCSTSADTYIPIENISNTQSCSFLESRLVSLYGGKAASLLIEYQQRLALYVPLYVYPPASFPSETNLSVDAKQSIGVRSRGLAKGNRKEGLRSWETSRSREALHSFLASQKTNILSLQSYGDVRNKDNTSIDVVNKSLASNVRSSEDISPLQNKERRAKQDVSKASREGFPSDAQQEETARFERTQSISISSSFASKGKLAKRAVSSKPSEKGGFANDFVDNTSIYASKEPISYFNKLINNVQNWVLDPSKFSPLQTGLTTGETKGLNLDARLAKTYFAGAGNNIFQSTLGNIEIQTATRLANIMVNYWSFYSLNKNTAFLRRDVKQLVGVKGRRGLLSKGLARFEETTEGYKPQPATDSSINEVNKSVKGTPLLSRLFTPKQYKALRLCIPSETKDAKAIRAIPLLSLAHLKGHTSLTCGALPSETKDKMLTKLSLAHQEFSSLGVEKQGVADSLVRSKKRRVMRSKEGVKQSRPLLAPTFHYDKHNVKVLGIKSKVKEKTPKVFTFIDLAREPIIPSLTSPSDKMLAQQKAERAKLPTAPPSETKAAKLEETYKCKNLHFAIMQSKNSLKICENKNLSYNIRRLSVENMGGYSQLNNNNFQLINSLQFSNLQRDRFYPTWFRLYLPDIEATEFLKNVANYYFSLGLQTFTLPSTKLNPFATFLNKHTLNTKGFYSRCSLLQRSINTSDYNSCGGTLGLRSWQSVAEQQRRGLLKVKDSSCTKLAKDQLDTAFSLLVENKIFPLNYNYFSVVEKELLYDTLVNSCFAKAFYLINQNRQLLDFFVDYLLRFQILRQHQILYLFSTLLVGCNKSQITLANL